MTDFSDYFTNFNKEKMPPPIDKRPYGDIQLPATIADISSPTLFKEVTENLDGYKKISAVSGVEISPVNGLSLTTGLEVSLNRYETPVSRFNTIGIGPKVTMQKDIGKNGKVRGSFTPASRYETFNLGVSFNF